MTRPRFRDFIPSLMVYIPKHSVFTVNVVCFFHFFHFYFFLEIKLFGAKKIDPKVSRRYIVL